MMRLSYCLLFLSLIPLSIQAEWKGAHDPHQHTVAASEQTISATGKIKSIAENGSSVRIFHDPIPELNWPAMNMFFIVNDPAMIDNMKPEDRVSFEFIRQEGENVIVKIAK